MLLFRSVFMTLGLAIAVQAGPKEDSGWVSLFNGTDFNDFYAYFQDNGVVDMAKQDAFFIDEGLLHVRKAHDGGFSKIEGHLITRKEYSWYRVRVDYRYSTNAEAQNAGLVIHIENKAALVDGIKTLRPRSIEINMRRMEASPWTLWSATGLGPYITTTVKAGTNNYLAKDQGGVEWTNDPWGERIIRTTLPNSEKAMGEWNHGEALVAGDSMLVCTLNGQLRTVGWHLQLRGSPNDATPSKRVPCDRGGIGLQSEGQEIWYRNFEIMELEPHTLKPLNAKPTGLARNNGYGDGVDIGNPALRALRSDGNGHLTFSNREKRYDAAGRKTGHPPETGHPWRRDVPTDTHP